MVSVDYSEHGIEAKKLIKEVEDLIRYGKIEEAISTVNLAVVELRLMKAMLALQLEK